MAGARRRLPAHGRAASRRGGTARRKSRPSCVFRLQRPDPDDVDQRRLPRHRRLRARGSSDRVGGPDDICGDEHVAVAAGGFHRARRVAGRLSHTRQPSRRFANVPGRAADVGHRLRGGDCRGDGLSPRARHWRLARRWRSRLPGGAARDAPVLHLCRGDRHRRLREARLNRPSRPAVAGPQLPSAHRVHHVHRRLLSGRASVAVGESSPPVCPSLPMALVVPDHLVRVAGAGGWRSRRHGRMGRLGRRDRVRRLLCAPRRRPLVARLCGAAVGDFGGVRTARPPAPAAPGLSDGRSVCRCHTGPRPIPVRSPLSAGDPRRASDHRCST